jgi:hypothetical protein
MNEELPQCIRIQKSGKYKYRCACQLGFNDEEEAFDHMSTEYIGFCINGLKCNGDDNYECICGVKDMTRNKAGLKHFYDNKLRCFKKKLTKTKAYCKICNLQCYSQAAYEIHCDTISHNEKINPTKISLQCKICNLTFSCQNDIKKHLETKKHKKNEASGIVVQEKLPLQCTICNIKVNSQAQIRAHLVTNKHLKKIEKIIM